VAIRNGQRLGPYEILSAVGAGGMGEVYRARDTRLDRIVAVKVLPGHLADKPELRERFEREARTIASLNHPHICTLYDVGREGGTDYLVMEYIEGETLAQRLAKGALPLEWTLQYAIEIADALDKAHRKGITHRDLKPGNIMLTKPGTKLLDFGLAKLAQDAAPVTPESQLPTMKDAITAQGTILGTLQYMAPEQVEGKEADARTDIFAFGVVVYEMATGKKAFEGKSQASLMAKILETDPAPMSALVPMTPPALDRLVKKCLAKEPDRRWQAASDICDELKWIAEGSSQTGMPAPVAATHKSPLRDARLAWFAAAAFFGAALALGYFAYFKRTPEQTRAVRFTLSPPDKWSLAGTGAVTTGATASVRISPDGQRVAFWPRQFMTVGVILALAGVNIRGVQWGGTLQVILTTVKVASLVGIAVLPFVSVLWTEPKPLPQATNVPTWGITNFGLALIGVIWASCVSELFARGFQRLVDPQDTRQFDPRQTAQDLDKLAMLVRHLHIPGDDALRRLVLARRSVDLAFARQARLDGVGAAFAVLLRRRCKFQRHEADLHGDHRVIGVNQLVAGESGRGQHGQDAVDEGRADAGI